MPEAQAQRRPDLGELLAQLRGRNLRLAQAAAQRIVMAQNAFDLRLQRGQVGEVHHAHGAAADLVFVGWADATLGGADLTLTGSSLAQSIKLAVKRQDQSRVLGDPQVFAADRDSKLFNTRDLVSERPWVDHDAIADHGKLVLAHDTGGKQRELVGRTVDYQRMAGIVAALKAHHHIGALGKPIDNLALAFVAPLGADDHDVGHDEIP